ncbi:MAG TPA: C40 family peptidase [Bacteroidota bacterium]|nr:C40 family peptidase [Bacteroidota bacterium]
MKVLVFSLVCLFAAGCGSSSPRFVSHDSTEKSEKPEKKNSGPRFSSRHIEEEKKEDDRKVDVKQVTARFSSAKPSPSVSQQSNDSRAGTSRTTPKAPAGKIDDQKMMDVILGYLGTPYVYGGDSKSGIDCSAFTGAVYNQSVSVQLPRSAAEQVKVGTPVAFEDLRFGDLMFFNTTGANPSHVGIYIGDDLFAHASEAFGVTISSIESSYYKKRYTEARRVVE